VWLAMRLGLARLVTPIFRVIHLASVIKLNFKQCLKQADADLIKAQADSLEMSNEART
jgi:hypothetical protein